MLQGEVPGTARNMHRLCSGGGEEGGGEGIPHRGHMSFAGKEVI